METYPKTERLLKEFCKDVNEDYISLYLHTHVRGFQKATDWRCLLLCIMDFDMDHEHNIYSSTQTWLGDGNLVRNLWWLYQNLLFGLSINLEEVEGSMCTWAPDKCSFIYIYI